MGWLLIVLVVTNLVVGPHWAVPVFLGVGAVEVAVSAGSTYRGWPSRL